MRATIDRIEGLHAVLISREDESVRFTIPLLLLPHDCQEGDIVQIGIERDSQMTESVKLRISDRIENLKNR